jgi:hypothetical protein
MELRQPLAPALRFAVGPCPFCGTTPEAVAELRRFEGLQARILHQVICGCGASGPARSSLTEAAKAWDAPSRCAPSALRQFASIT